MTDPIDERAEAVIALYENLAECYVADRLRAAWDERPWFDRFIAELADQRCVLDLGCGAGEPVGRYLLDHGCTLTGVDSSAALIAHCRRQFPAATWLLADMRHIALPQRFHGLVAWDSFFHLPPHDQRRMFELFQAHAAPAALLLFTTGPRRGVAIGSYQGQPLYHSSLEASEYEALLVAHGFNVVSHVSEDPSCGGRTVWLARQSG